jgi:hypothetical protein
MAISSFLIVVLIALVLGIIGVVFIRKTQTKTLELRAQRRELIRRSEVVNLPRMLQALGIGIGRYFYQMPPKDIEQSVENCESCKSIDPCNQKLRIPELNPDDIGFCPSKENLSQFSRARRIRGDQQPIPPVDSH